MWRDKDIGREKVFVDSRVAIVLGIEGLDRPDKTWSRMRMLDSPLAFLLV